MIRLAKISDLNKISEIYSVARGFMRKNGNPHQWGDSYPEEEIIVTDIENNQLFVAESDSGEICGCFALIWGDDPTYRIIDGKWLSCEPYAAMHRVASDGRQKGVFSQMVSFALTKYNHLRIDTYKDNKTMQYVILKNGFEYCGTIYLEDGSPRMAYELI